jgi:predicted anti-sigma-YlaC factor YlaD
MLDCKRVTRLLSDALDRPLSTVERLGIVGHLPTCSGCRAYRRQIARIRETMRDAAHGAYEASDGDDGKQGRG